jgi:hypothetical protein
MVFFNDPVPLPRPGRTCSQDRDGDTGGSQQIDRDLATARPCTWLWRWYRARLCDAWPDRFRRPFRLHGDRAEDGQILVDQRVVVAVEEMMALEEVGTLNLKGLTPPVAAFNVPRATTQGALRVIEGGFSSSARKK